MSETSGSWADTVVAPPRTHEEDVAALDVEIGGATVVLRADRTAWLPDAGALLAADLHLGRAEAQQARGEPVPSGGDADDLARLRGALDATGAARLALLGDVIHAADGATDAVIARLTALVDEVGDVRVALGNHDRGARHALEAVGFTQLAPRLDLAGLALLHDPADAARGARFVAGHLHPAVRLAAEGDALTLPCFVASGDALILPAFSRGAAGARQRRRPGLRFFVTAEDSIFEV